MPPLVLVNPKQLGGMIHTSEGSRFERSVSVLVALLPLHFTCFVLTRPSVPLTGLRFSLQGHSPGFSCIGPLGASKSIGLGRT